MKPTDGTGKRNNKQDGRKGLGRTARNRAIRKASKRMSKSNGMTEVQQLKAMGYSDRIC